MRNQILIFLSFVVFSAGFKSWAEDKNDLGSRPRFSNSSDWDDLKPHAKDKKDPFDKKQGSRKSRSSRDILLDEVDAILKPSLQSSGEKDRTRIKKGGGGQDGGGGGSGDEALFNFYFNLQVRKMRPFLPVIRQLELLSPEQIQILESTFPKYSKTSQLCVLISEKDIAEICPPERKKIFVPLSDWKNLSEADQKLRVRKELLELLGVTDPDRQVEVDRQMESIIDEKADTYHRFTFSQGNWALRDKNTTVSYKIEIQPAANGFRFVVQSPTESHIYQLNANSPFFNLNPCSPDKAKDPYFEIFNSEYVYRELKPLAQSCQKLVTAGGAIRSFWVSDKTGLVFKCD